MFRAQIVGLRMNVILARGGLSALGTDLRLCMYEMTTVDIRVIVTIHGVAVVVAAGVAALTYITVGEMTAWHETIVRMDEFVFGRGHQTNQTIGREAEALIAVPASDVEAGAVIVPMESVPVTALPHAPAPFRLIHLVLQMVPRMHIMPRTTAQLV